MLATWRMGEPLRAVAPVILMKARLVKVAAAAACRPKPVVPAAAGPSPQEVNQALVTLANGNFVGQGPAKEARKVKASSIIDPADESEVVAASPPQIKEWYANYKALKHGAPLRDKDPSPDQISAMHTRVVVL